MVHISDEGLVAGSVNRAELAAAYNEASDEAVRANLAAVGAEHGMVVEDGRLVDPSAPYLEPEEELEVEEEEAEPEPSGRPAQADNKAAWVDWAVSQGVDRDDAEAYTKADLIELYGSE
jgi:hypothetical protein